MGRVRGGAQPAWPSGAGAAAVEEAVPVGAGVGGTSGSRSGCASSQSSAMVVMPLKSSARVSSRSRGSRSGARCRSCSRSRPPTCSKAVREMTCGALVVGVGRSRARGRSTRSRSAGRRRGWPRRRRRARPGLAGLAAGSRPCGGRLVEQLGGDLVEDLLADRDQQLVEAGDVVEDRAPRDAGRRGDLLDGEAVRAVLGGQGAGRVEDRGRRSARRALRPSVGGAGSRRALLHSVQIVIRVSGRGDDRESGAVARSKPGSSAALPRGRWSARRAAGAAAPRCG